MYNFGKLTYTILILICTTGLGISIYQISWDNLQSFKSAYSELVVPFVFLGCAILFILKINALYYKKK
jgi:hypothetical protein